MKEKDIIRSKLTSNNYEIPNINNFSSEIQQSIIDYIEQIWKNKERLCHSTFNDKTQYEIMNDDAFEKEAKIVEGRAYHGTHYDVYRLTLNFNDKPDFGMEIRSNKTASVYQSYDKIDFKEDELGNLHIYGEYTIAPYKMRFSTMQSKTGLLEPINITLDEFDYISANFNNKNKYTVNTFDELKESYMQEVFRIAKENARPNSISALEECESNYYNNKEENIKRI